MVKIEKNLRVYCHLYTLKGLQIGLERKIENNGVCSLSNSMGGNEVQQEVHNVWDEVVSEYHMKFDFKKCEYRLRFEKYQDF